MHEWKIYGAKKENDDIEIKLTHKHFEPIVFDRVLRFDDAILLAARMKILPKNLNLEGAHTATLYFQENVTSSNRTCWTATNGRYS